MRRIICCLLSAAVLSAAASPGTDEPSGIATYAKLHAEMARGVDASGIQAMPEGAKPWLENRISRCFFGPIKRPPFNRDELMDNVDYYPDAYLAQLRDEGVNGLWLTIEFRDLVETSFNRRHPTAARRLDKLRRTVEKCARYGIGVWVFAIEPMCGKASPEFYAANKALFADDRYHLMCPSKPEAQQYLKEALKDLFAQVTGLMGFINICHGERRTTCLGQFAPCTQGAPRPLLCPACSKRQPWEVMNDILVPMRDGISEAGSDARLVCWFYMPEPYAERSEWVYDCARHIPEGVSFQMNFESGIVCGQEGRPRVGGDYWLSQPGPSDIFRRTAEACRESGSRLAAKIQVSVSHEMATVPHVPVPGLIYRKFKAMRECGVKDAMYCWYFGCSPGLMNRAAGMLSCEDFSGGEEAFLGRLAKAEWGEDAYRVAGLWKTFAAAYGNYPVSNMMQYYGPFHDGVAWELHPLLDLKPLSRSWKCDRADGDTIGECLEGFSLDEARRLADAMCAPLDGCLVELDALAAKYADDVRRSREIGVMKAFVVLCRSGRDVLAFYQARRNAVLASRVRYDSAETLRHVAEMRRLAESARVHSAAMIPLCERDSRLGFHPEAETYKFNPGILRRRIGDIDRVMRELDGIERELAAGRLYPESNFERSAPLWNAVRCEDGQVVVEGRVATGQVDSVKIDLYDETGSEYPTQIVAKVEGGLFTAALPEGNWRWIHVSGPGIPDIPAVKAPVPWRLKLDWAAVRNCARLAIDTGNVRLPVRR